jgi:hypothetical protein
MCETVNITVRRGKEYQRFQAVAHFLARPRNLRKKAMVALKYEIARLLEVAPKCVNVSELGGGRRLA